MRNSSKTSSLTIRCPPVKGKWVNVFANGSRKNKRVLISPYATRCFDSLLNHLTDKVKPTFGAVRNIYTIEGQLITDLGSIENEKTYVVTGVEKFRPGNFGACQGSRIRIPTGQGYGVRPRVPDGGDIGSLKENLTQRSQHRRISKEFNLKKGTSECSEDNQVHPVQYQPHVVYQTSTLNPAQHARLQEIIDQNTGNQRHEINTSNYSTYMLPDEIIEQFASGFH